MIILWFFLVILFSMAVAAIWQDMEDKQKSLQNEVDELKKKLEASK